MTLRQLRIFSPGDRLGSDSSAEEELQISQPSVSIQVADLERVLGVDLFTQEGRRAHLTGAGRVLDEYARRILALVDDAEASVEGAKHPRRPQTAEQAPVGPGAVPPPFEVVEHTADVGLVAHGRSLEELLANAARGMMHFLKDSGAVRQVEHEAPT